MYNCKQEAFFKSDFCYVVHLLRQERLGEKFDMPPGEINHALELLELFFSLTGDMKFMDAVKKAQDMEKRGEPLNMRSFLTEAMNDGIAIGRDQERQFIMNRLIAGGMEPTQAVSIVGMPS